MPTPQAIKNQEEIKRIRQQLLAGKISYDEAADLADPIIRRINSQAKAVAKRHGLRPQQVSFSALMR